jgi:hypothetical protein
VDTIESNNDGMPPEAIGRGETYCRGCNSVSLQSCLDLGKLPLANELWKSQIHRIDLFPLHLRVCLDCGLGQVGEFVSPQRLFSDYRYLSSVSSSFIQHAKNFVDSLVETEKVKKGDWVLEIASNDGYLLQHFLPYEISVLGIEPATNVSEIAVGKGIPTINSFFTHSLALELLNEFGSPKLIIANNVLAHVPDMIDFLHGISTLADSNTLISIENPSLVNLLDANQFDTIYHEHYSYLSITSVSRIASKLGLNLIDFEQIQTHGGSNRYWLSKKLPSHAERKKIELQSQSELASGIVSKETWSKVSKRVRSLLLNFNQWILELSTEGFLVIGYGAAAKASTIINAAEIPIDGIKVIVDGSHEKQGRFMPAKGIPIISPDEIGKVNPTDIIIFPWNIADEIVKTIETFADGQIRIWTLIPEITRIR